jgi:DNA-binding NarL/FixJ family response regulator
MMTRSSSKVANELFASASSAKVHHVPVYSKLGVNDRTAAVAAALWSACYCR